MAFEIVINAQLDIMLISQLAVMKYLQGQNTGGFRNPFNSY